MIVTHIKDRRVYTAPVIPFTPTPPRHHNVAESTTMWAEVTRRDKIIKELSKTCPFVKGQLVRPVDAEAFKEHGECVVFDICRSYGDYGKDVNWPESDNPLIVTITTAPGHTLFTTVNYLKAI